MESTVKLGEMYKQTDRKAETQGKTETEEMRPRRERENDN